MNAQKKSSTLSERERSLELLRRIERESLFASLALIGESGFVRTIVLGVLRWRSRLDWSIEQLAARRIAKIDPIVVDILRIGVYQMQFMDVPDYAAVSESVDLAAKRAKRARGFVNAVLRKAGAGIPQPADAATRLAHPKWLLDRWTRAYGEARAVAIAEANQQLSYPDALVLSGEAPAGSEPSRLVEGVVKLSGSSADLSRDRFYPMDEGSAVVAAMAANTSKDVLDLAAAPGGKTIFMRSRGAQVVSSDVSLSRLRPLMGAGNRVVVADGRQPPFRRAFGTVLLDAPCSATGTIRKNPELKWRLREEDLASFANLQRELLTSALALARESVVYSTCSLEAEENDAVVEAVLTGGAGEDTRATREDTRSTQFTRADATAFVPEGARSWVRDGVLRLTPDSGADGFTAFVLRRSR